MALRLNYEAYNPPTEMTTRDTILMIGNRLEGFARGVEPAVPLQFGSITAWAYNPANHVDNNEWLFLDDTLVTNNIWVAGISGSTNFKLQRTAFGLDFVTEGEWADNFHGLVGHSSYYPATDSFKIIDPIFLSADAADSLRSTPMHAYTTYDPYLDQETEWLVGWNKPVHVIDAVGQSIPNAYLRVYSSVFSDTTFYGVTDDTGYVVPLIWEFREKAIANDNPNRTTYNPGYTIRAQYGEAIETKAIIVEDFSTEEITLQLNQIIIRRGVITKPLEE
jgi:hypothetical protein